MIQEIASNPQVRKVALDLAVQYGPDAAKFLGGAVARKYGGAVGGAVFDVVADVATDELQKRHANGEIARLLNI
jgi:hypothetical protein